MIAGPRFAAWVAVLTLALPAQDRPPHQFHPIAGEAFGGTLRSIRAAGEDALTVEIDLASEDVRRIGLDFLRAIDLRPIDAGEAAEDRLWLRSGQALPARFRSATGDGADYDLPFTTGALQVPWRFVQAVRFAKHRDDDAGFASSLAQAPERDLLYALRDGKVVRLSVDFLGVEGGRAKVEFRGAMQELAVDRIYGLIFARSRGAAPDRQGKPRVAVVLASTGRRIEGRLSSMQDDTFALRLDEGAVIEFAADSVAGLRIFSDRLVYLSDLPATADQTAAFDQTWPWLVDRGPDGGPIRLVGGRAFTRGLVMFPRTRLTYAVDARFDLFKATIGMEESRGAPAHAVFRVLADGKVVFESDAVTGDSLPASIEVPITGVKQLALEADFGKNFDLGDVCVFADARVMKN